MASRKWFGLESKDIVTNIIALLALSLAGFTAFKQYALAPKLTLFATNLAMSAKDGPYIDLVVSNSGNTPGMIASIALYLNKPLPQGCAARPDKNWKVFELEDKSISAGVYSVKPGESVARRIYFNMEGPLAEMDQSEADQDGKAVRGFCLEVGTLDKENCLVWTRFDVGRMWFFPGKTYWGGSGDNVWRNASPDRQGTDRECPSPTTGL